MQIASLKLFMVLLGGKPAGRHTEQHDVFLGIGDSLKSLIPDMKLFWPEAKGKIHIDAYREVNTVDGFAIDVVEGQLSEPSSHQLFFLNLGGYKAGEFEESHYRMLAVAEELNEAKRIAKQTAFFKHHSLPITEFYHDATSHIDDKYGIDVDDLYQVEDMLPASQRDKYSLRITMNENGREDDIHLGYIQLKEL